MRIIEIHEEVEIEQDGKKVILEKGDKIRVLKEFGSVPIMFDLSMARLCMEAVVHFEGTSVGKRRFSSGEFDFVKGKLKELLTNLVGY